MTAASTLKVRRTGIDTQHETVAYMSADCPLCRSEGFAGHARIALGNARGKVILATLHHVTNGLVAPDEIGLSESAWGRLAVSPGEAVEVSHPPPLRSFGAVRGKMYGRRIEDLAMAGIVGDVVAGRYDDIALSAFLTACTAQPLDTREIVALTRAMVEAGDQLRWAAATVADKHSVGGLPGNRTTPIVVAIAAACGLTVPKTSSRAITSPAGTADTMETLTRVDLDLAAMRRVVEREGGCIVWGGAVRLSPADDTLIRVERALDLDSEGQLIASVLSKKIAAGSTHVVLDLPVGPTAKVRSAEAAATLGRTLGEVAAAFGLATRIVVTDGTQPVGRGIGPALEAHDVLAVLQGAPDAPADLRQRSLALAAALLELAGAAPAGGGAALAERSLAEGAAWRKFQAICEAQGGLRRPPRAGFRRPVMATAASRVASVDNRRLARVAKLAGAPADKAAGVELHARPGQAVAAGEPLFTVHAENPGELDYALAYVQANPDIVAREASL
ncbi:thymidine phosphorylase family protein [Falsiroseomonas sp. E2-1-a4]|uniref:thymidine phosphorylase family protein n=1 Tax=Falsiroseomonas sp. E2-1-a4 TaxID=3239299 RepID=UPI003F3650CF